MKQFLFLFFTCLCTTILHAQGSRVVSGIVLDSTKVSVIAATIKLTSAKDTLFTRSDVDGKFYIVIAPSEAHTCSSQQPIWEQVHS